MVVFWVVEPRTLVEDYWCFGSTCFLHHQDALITEAASTSEMSVNFYQIVYIIISQKTTIQFISMFTKTWLYKTALYMKSNFKLLF